MDSWTMMDFLRDILDSLVRANKKEYTHTLLKRVDFLRLYIFVTWNFDTRVYQIQVFFVLFKVEKIHLLFLSLKDNTMEIVLL